MRIMKIKGSEQFGRYPEIILKGDKKGETSDWQVESHSMVNKIEWLFSFAEKLGWRFWDFAVIMEEMAEEGNVYVWI